MAFVAEAFCKVRCRNVEGVVCFEGGKDIRGEVVVYLVLPLVIKLRIAVIHLRSRAILSVALHYENINIPETT